MDALALSTDNLGILLDVLAVPEQEPENATEAPAQLHFPDELSPHLRYLQTYRQQLRLFKAFRKLRSDSSGLCSRPMRELCAVASMIIAY